MATPNPMRELVKANNRDDRADPKRKRLMILLDPMRSANIPAGSDPSP
jgi:hypothetical protein